MVACSKIGCQPSDPIRSVPINTIRRLTGHQRSAAANRQLGLTLAFVAGAINAGGLLAVGQYTSHVSGMVSSVADHLVLGNHGLVLLALGAVAAFGLGAEGGTVEGR